VEYYQCRDISIESSTDLPVHVDGETFGKTPVSMRAVPSSLKVIVSKTLPRNLFRTDG